MWKKKKKSIIEVVWNEQYNCIWYEIWFACLMKNEFEWFKLVMDFGVLWKFQQMSKWTGTPGAKSKERVSQYLEM